MKISSLVSLERQYTFYKHYHSNTINRRIHYVFVPVLIITAFTMLAEFSLPFPFPLNDASRLVLALYILHSLVMDMPLGLGHTLFLLAYHRLSLVLRTSVGEWNALPVAFSLHMLAWAAQFVGHYTFERKAPAVMDSFVQAISSGPIVIWLEALFSLGFLPEVKARLARAPVAARARKAVANAPANG